MDNFIHCNPDSNICVQSVPNASSIKLVGLKSSVDRHEIVANQLIHPIKAEIPEGYPFNLFSKNLQLLDETVWTVMNHADLKPCITFFLP